MRRCDICNICLWIFQLWYSHSIVIHCNRHCLISQCLNHSICLLVCRIFKCNSMFFSKDHTKQYQNIITSRSDHDLLRRTVHASCLIQIIADGSPESIFTLRISWTEQLRPVIQQNVFRKFSPDIIWKTVKIYSVRCEIIAVYSFLFSLTFRLFFFFFQLI